MAVRYLAVLGCCAVVTACFGAPGERPSSHPAPADKPGWQAALLGTTPEEAVRVCRKWGFAPVRQHGDFIEAMDRSQVLYRNLDYLYLDREEGRGAVTRRVQIALVLETNRVTRLLYSTGLTGP